MSSSNATNATQPQRPRDLLRATSTPIHPFDQIHGTDTSGLVPAADLVTGHPHAEVRGIMTKH